MIKLCDLFCWGSRDMRGGSGILNVIEVQPTESNRINLSIFPQQAGLICLLDQVKGLNGWCSAAILSDLNTLNLAQSLRQTIYLFGNRRLKLQKDAGILRRIWVADFSYLMYKYQIISLCKLNLFHSLKPTKSGSSLSFVLLQNKETIVVPLLLRHQIRSDQLQIITNSTF